MKRTLGEHPMTGLQKLCALVTNRSGKSRRRQKHDNGRYVVYYRVSTKQQGESGLGLDAQRAAVESYIKQHGGEIIAEYEEIESGKDCKRPKIIEAILHCNRSWATLLIAKMDRLARNVFFISTLMESNVPFLACDNPHASRLNVHILAAVAEEETRLISERTKAALQAFRLRGGSLGPATFKDKQSWRPKQEQSRTLATRRNSEIAATAYGEVRPIIQSLRGQGWSFQSIANELNRLDHRTRRGAAWSKVQVRRVANRFIAQHSEDVLGVHG
jgi:DNA invertase Pin-like site-specific DNA recombinase